MGDSPAHDARPHVDVRTRAQMGPEPVDPDHFWTNDWLQALAANGPRATADAVHLGLAPLTLRIEGRSRTLQVRDGHLEAATTVSSAPVVDLDRTAFGDLVDERKTALGLAVAGRIEGDGEASQLFNAWDPVLRSALDGRGLYRPGDVALRDADGGELDLDQRFGLDRASDGADPSEPPTS